MICQRMNIFFFFYKFSVFLWRALKVGKSASVGNVYFHLKNRLKDMFQVNEQTLKKYTLERIIELENQ